MKIESQHTLVLSDSEYDALICFLGSTSTSDRKKAGLSKEQDDLLSQMYRAMSDHSEAEQQ